MTEDGSEDRLGDEDAILARMLRSAEDLCRTADPMMAGQYRHLRDRIRALIELRECGLEPPTA